MQGVKAESFCVVGKAGRAADSRDHNNFSRGIPDFAKTDVRTLKQPK